MLKNAFIFYLTTFLCGNALKAQFSPSSHISENGGGFQATNGTVGVPLSFQFEPQNPGFGPGVPYTCTFAALSNNPPPPGLTLSSSGLLSGTPTQAGSFNFAINITYNITGGGSITLGILGGAVIATNTNPLTSVSSSALSFSFTEGSTEPISQSVTVTNNFHLGFTYFLSFITYDGANWLNVLPAVSGMCIGGVCGIVQAFSTTSAAVTVDPRGLRAGTYLGAVGVQIDKFYEIPVLVTVSSAQPQLQLSQSGLFFKTVAGGANPASQSITVLDAGGGPFDFTVSTSTTTGGSNWLSASPETGITTSSTSASVAVNIDSAGLSAGDYYGLVQFSPKGDASSLRAATVVLHVDAAGADVGASLSETGLVFVGQAGGSNPAAQTISITNPSPSTLTFSAATFYNTGNNWFAVTPATGMVNATTPAQISVQPTISGLASGVYSGELVLQFAEDASARHIAVLLIVTPAGSTRTAHGAAAACKPTMLLPVFTQLGADFSVSLSWPTPIEVTVVDDCGTFLTTGSVTASFSDNDPSLPLTSLRDGRWSATWQPGSSSVQVVITAQATELSPALQGTKEIGGALLANQTTPAVNAVVSAAHYADGQPIAPGAFISIYGVNLSSGPNPALSLPLATQLGSTQVVLGGRALPLQYAGDGQVNAILPYDIPANSTQQLIVSNGPALSVPRSVVIAPTQPAVFAQDDGYGVVFDVKPNSSAQVLVDAGHPISAGDALVIYCSGLGAVSPQATAGTAAPSSPPAATTNSVSVSIGGKAAKVFFSGLVGGFAGLYQVNAYVPSGIAAGDSVPLIITVAGLNSAPVNVAVK